MAREKIKIMVSSTVYGNENILDQIAVILRQKYGYDVIMSKEGSVYVPVDCTENKEKACLRAVYDCDMFLGIIFPRYGSGITHKEFLEAKRLNRPRIFLAHERIELLRKLFHPYLFDEDKQRTDFEIKENSVLDSIKVVDMFYDVSNNWIQPFSYEGELLFFIEQQFKDHKKRITELQKHKP